VDFKFIVVRISLLEVDKVEDDVHHGGCGAHNFDRLLEFFLVNGHQIREDWLTQWPPLHVLVHCKIENVRHEEKGEVKNLLNVNC
jgi:hypothetical protein